MNRKKLERACLLNMRRAMHETQRTNGCCKKRIRKVSKTDTKSGASSVKI